VQRRHEADPLDALAILLENTKLEEKLAIRIDANAGNSAYYIETAM
jgi:hypothetical protein